MSDDAVLERLDRLIGIVRVAFAPAIDTARAAVRSDPVKSALLDATTDGWTSSAATRAAVAKLGISDSTFKSKISELIASGLVERRGATKTVEYRSRGIL